MLMVECVVGNITFTFQFFRFCIRPMYDMDVALFVRRVEWPPRNVRKFVLHFDSVLFSFRIYCWSFQFIAP